MKKIINPIKEKVEKKIKLKVGALTKQISIRALESDVSSVEGQ